MVFKKKIFPDTLMGNVMLTFCDAVTKTMRKCLLSYFRGFDSKSIELTQLQLPIHNMEKLGNIQKKKVVSSFNVYRCLLRLACISKRSC